MADLTVTATQVIPASTVVLKTGIAGETITAGMGLYISSADSKLYKALNDTAAHGACVGIAMSSGSAGQSVIYAGNVGDVITIGAGAAPTVGETYIVSANAGGLAPIADISTHFVSYAARCTAAATLTLMLINTGIAHA